MIRTVLVALLLFASSGASADTLTWRFDYPKYVNNSFLFGSFGDESGPFTGNIVSTKVVFDGYTTTGEIDAADFYYTFDVPALGKESHVYLSGADLGWSGHGPFSHSFTTDMYNGEIRAGRFGSEYAGGGTFSGDAYIEFTIEGLRADPIFADSFDTPDDE